MDIITSTDERRGLPSASAFARLLACKGAWPLEQALARSGITPAEKSMDFTEHGNKVHKFAELMLIGTKIEETEAQENADAYREAEELCEILRREVNKWTGQTHIPDHCEVLIEERMWLHVFGEDVASGRADFIIIDRVNRRAFIADFKAGWLDTPKGRENKQLEGLAMLLVSNNPEIEKVAVVIIETMSVIVTEEWEAEELGAMRMKVADLYCSGTDDPAFKAYAPKVDNCRYCKVRAYCPMTNFLLNRLSTTAIVAEMEDAELERTKNALQIMTPLERAVDGEMERRIHMGSSFTGYVFASAPGKRKVTNPTLTMQRLMGLGIDAKAIFDAASIPVGAAEALHKKATGLQGKGARADFDEMFSDVIRKDETAPSIRARK